MAKLPYLFLPTPGGAWTSIKELVLKGRNILFFWGTFSEDSRKSLLKLNNSREIKGSVAAISLDAYNFRGLNKFLADNKISIPCLLDNMLTVVRLLNITEVPYFLKINDDLEVINGGNNLTSLSSHEFTPDYAPKEYELELQEMINQLGRGNNDHATKIIKLAYERSKLELIGLQIRRE